MRRNQSSRRPSQVKDDLNEGIRARQVMVIDQEGKNLGVLSIRDAIDLARKDGLDLVKVGAGKNGIPVCRVMDHGKWQFEQKKRQKEMRRKSSQGQLKEIKVRPNTSDHDMGYRVDNAVKFLEAGHRVKVLVRFRGREHRHMMDTGKAMLEKFVELLGNKYPFSIDKPADIEAHSVSIILSPQKT